MFNNFCSWFYISLIVLSCLLFFKTLTNLLPYILITGKIILSSLGHVHYMSFKLSLSNGKISIELYT